MSLRSRMAFFSGFLYYLHTGLTSLYVTLIPLYVLFVIPDSVKPIYSLFFIPGLILSWVIYPLWHKSTYGIEAWTMKHVYGWAHLFAIVDKLTKSSMKWQPTGAVKKSDSKYVLFRLFQLLFCFIPAIVWILVSSFYVYNGDYQFIPFLLSGCIYFAIISKVSLYGLREVIIKTYTLTKTTARNTYTTIAELRYDID